MLSDRKYIYALPPSWRRRTVGNSQVGVYTGSILKGANPADLAVVQSTKFMFAINVRTARELGIAVSPDVLSIADEVIE